MASSNKCFSFLRVALGNAESLPFTPNGKDWQALYDFCKRQALTGIGFAAVDKLHRQGVECPAELKMRWMALALSIEKKNVQINEQCRQLTEILEHDGMQCCILKGQGNQFNYPEELKRRRNPGDIDVWCVAPREGLPIAVQTGKNTVEYVTYHGEQAIREYARRQYQWGAWSEACEVKSPKLCYHHIKAPSINGTEVEMHYKPGYLHSPIRNIRMQRWFKVHADECMGNRTQAGFAMPTASVNVVHQMCHLFNHYFDEGLGLRQIIDYYFTLRVWHNDCMEKYDLQSQGMWSEGLGVPLMSKEEVMRTLRRFGMGKFAAAIMWVLHEMLAMPEEYLLCRQNEKEGQKLLAEIILSGNFGQYDERGKEMKNGGMLRHGWWKLKRIMRFAGSYPEEVLCEPIFRVWHLGWRIINK